MQGILRSVARTRLHPDVAESLRFYFCDYEGCAGGLRSSFGAQLERAAGGTEAGVAVRELFAQEAWVNEFGRSRGPREMRRVRGALERLGRLEAMVLLRLYGPRDAGALSEVFGEELGSVADLTREAEQVARRSRGGSSGGEGDWERRRGEVEAAFARGELTKAERDRRLGELALARGFGGRGLRAVEAVPGRGLGGSLDGRGWVGVRQAMREHWRGLRSSGRGDEARRWVALVSGQAEGLVRQASRAYESAWRDERGAR